MQINATTFSFHILDTTVLLLVLESGCRGNPSWLQKHAV